MINVQIIKPLPGLEQFISCYCFNTLTEDSIKTRIRILAGSGPTLFIYYHGSKYNALFKNKSINDPNGIVGPLNLRNDELWVFQNGSGILECVTIIFTHIGFFRIFGIPMKELSSSLYTPSEVSLPAFKEVIMKMDDALDNISRAEILNGYFKKQFICMDKYAYRYKYMHEIINYILSQKSGTDVRNVCEYVCMTERSLENWFKTFIGSSPRDFIHNIRFQNLLKKIYYNNATDINWHDIVCDYGYYDQAHLINEFKDATSVTPEYFFKNRHVKFFYSSNSLCFPETGDNNLFQETTLIHP